MQTVTGEGGKEEVTTQEWWRETGETVGQRWRISLVSDRQRRSVECELSASLKWRISTQTNTQKTHTFSQACSQGGASFWDSEHSRTEEKNAMRERKQDKLREDKWTGRTWWTLVVLTRCLSPDQRLGASADSFPLVGRCRHRVTMAALVRLQVELREHRGFTHTR